MQAPPTLAPSDPLSLSPLPELPYLFALEVPEAAQQAQRALESNVTALGGGADQVVQAATQRAQARACTRGRESFAAALDPRLLWSPARGSALAMPCLQKQLQTRRVGHALQSVFMEEALGGGDALEESDSQRTAVQVRGEGWLVGDKHACARSPEANTRA